MKQQRIIGIDIARALAVIGMVIVNFKIALGTNGNHWVNEIAGVFDGKAAATFVVLAGVGIALMTNGSFREKKREEMKKKQVQLLKKAFFLFVVGVSYTWIWPADILHYYGVYMVFALFFMYLPLRQLLSSSLLIVFIFPTLLLVFDYEYGWDFKALSYWDMWSFNGFVRNLLFNGFHPVFPWVAFIIFGIWLGRQELSNSKVQRRLFTRALIAFVCIQLISILLQTSMDRIVPNESESLGILFGTVPMPPLPLYMLNGASIATMIIIGSIWIGTNFEFSWWAQALKSTGQLALTFYVAHVVVGLGVIEIFGSQDFGEYSIGFSLGYALVFSLGCVLFAKVWLRNNEVGPLEYVMKRLIQ